MSTHQPDRRSISDTSAPDIVRVPGSVPPGLYQLGTGRTYTQDDLILVRIAGDERLHVWVRALWERGVRP
jgi:hypothetical protein